MDVLRVTDLTDPVLRGKAAEHRRSPKRWRGFRELPTSAKRHGVRRSSGAFVRGHAEPMGHRVVAGADAARDSANRSSFASVEEEVACFRCAIACGLDTSRGSRAPGKAAEHRRSPKCWRGFRALPTEPKRLEVHRCSGLAVLLRQPLHGVDDRASPGYELRGEALDTCRQSTIIPRPVCFATFAVAQHRSTRRVTEFRNSTPRNSDSTSFPANGQRKSF